MALCGSCSKVSRSQVAEYLRTRPGLAVDPAKLLEGRITAGDVRTFVNANLDAGPIVYSTADPSDVADVQNRFGLGRVAAAVEAFFAALSEAVVEDGVTRIVVGGGETAGAVVAARGLAGFAVGPEIDPGVPALSTRVQGRELRIALKSGNFGSPNFFEKALRVLGAA